MSRRRRDEPGRVKWRLSELLKAAGRTLARTLADLRRDVPGLTEGQVTAVRAGHAVGVMELADFLRDKEAGADRPVCDEEYPW